VGGAKPLAVPAIDVRELSKTYKVVGSAALFWGVGLATVHFFISKKDNENE